MNNCINTIAKATICKISIWRAGNPYCICKSAQATRVGVALREEEGELVLAVADNGRGITEAEKASRESLGILGMQERAHLIGGRVDIVGVRGAGTTLRVHVPLPTAESVGAI